MLCFADDEQGDHETAQTEPLQLPLQYSDAVIYNYISLCILSNHISL